MNETIEEYKNRINSYSAGRDALALLSEAPGKFERAIGGASQDRLARRPSPDLWSVAEIMAHLAEAELVGAYRIRMILSAPGAPIQAYDQDRWASLGQYGRRDTPQSLELFRVLRNANVSLLKSLNAEQWELYGLHSERGQESIRALAGLHAGHDLNHLEQIKKILEVH